MKKHSNMSIQYCDELNKNSKYVFLFGGKKGTSYGLVVLPTTRSVTRWDEHSNFNNSCCFKIMVLNQVWLSSEPQAEQPCTSSSQGPLT